MIAFYSSISPFEFGFAPTKNLEKILPLKWLNTHFLLKNLKEKSEDQLFSGFSKPEDTLEVHFTDLGRLIGNFYSKFSISLPRSVMQKKKEKKKWKLGVLSFISSRLILRSRKVKLK